MGVAGLLTRIGIGRTEQAPQAPPHQRIGNYRLLRLLGRGGMGEVWLGSHQTTQEMVAIKIVRGAEVGADRAQHDLSMQRLQREARAIARVRSPNVVRLLDSGLTPTGAFYYAMEFVDGVTLETMVRALGGLEWRLAMYLLRGVAAGLEAAHSHGLVHCDVSPANVIVCTGDGRPVPRLIDFGLVRFIRDVSGTTHLSLPVLAAGTPAYMAPELILRRPVDPRTDIYAWGCVATRLLTARTLFDAESPVEMALAQLTEKPQPPSLRARHPLPAALDALVLTCLAKDPAARPASMKDVIQALDDLECGEPSEWSGPSDLSVTPNLAEEPTACDAPVA